MLRRTAQTFTRTQTIGKSDQMPEIRSARECAGVACFRSTRSSAECGVESVAASRRLARPPENSSRRNRVGAPARVAASSDCLRPPDDGQRLQRPERLAARCSCKPARERSNNGRPIWDRRTERLSSDGSMTELPAPSTLVPIGKLVASEGWSLRCSRRSGPAPARRGRVLRQILPHSAPKSKAWRSF